MKKTRADYVAANRAAWEASAPQHRAGAAFAELAAGFARPGFSCLDEILTAALAEVGLAGKAAAQLCCNNGREILSLENLGAGPCVGFDQSGAFLAQARELAAAGGLESRFVETDVYAIPAEYDGKFDLVMITIGVFGWMPDLGRFFDVAARLLTPGGALVVYEQHPIMNMTEPWDADDPHRLAHSYFKAEPFEETESIVYDDSARAPVSTHYWFVHTLADILTACLERGLALEGYREYPHNISSADYDIYDGQPAQLPQTYLLVARKAG